MFHPTVCWPHLEHKSHVSIPEFLYSRIYQIQFFFFFTHSFLHEFFYTQFLHTIFAHNFLHTVFYNRIDCGKSGEYSLLSSILLDTKSVLILVLKTFYYASFQCQYKSILNETIVSVKWVALK